MESLPYHLTIPQVLSLANTKDAPWIKKRRTLHPKRALYSVRSDFLVYYTDIWYRNRNPDTDRVFEIMKSIEKEGEPDNRIYVAWIKGVHGVCKLLCFDGNHRREALIRLYRMKGFTCWIDLDILMNVDDIEVVRAFRRINLGVSIPDVYLEDIEQEAVTQVPLEQTTISSCEQFVVDFRKRWKHVIVDKNKTRSPYCTKNDLIELTTPFLKKVGASELLTGFEAIHHTGKQQHLSTACERMTQKTCQQIECYIFVDGIKQVKKQLEQLYMMY